MTGTRQSRRAHLRAAACHSHQIACNALAQSTGACGTSNARATEKVGRATIAVNTCADNAGKAINVYVGDETYSAQVNDRGEAELSFVLPARDTKVSVEVPDERAKNLTISAPEFGDIYRVVLRWHAKVQLKLHVIEPGHRQNEYGHVSADRRNLDLSQGVGMVDLASGPPEEGYTAEQSYVLTNGPRDATQGVFKSGSSSRRAAPAPPRHIAATRSWRASPIK